MKTSAFASLLTLTAVAFVVGGCRRADQENAAAPVAPEAVRTARVVTVEQPDELALPGVVRPLERAVVAARVAGAVAEARFRVGQVFAAGETILVIDAPEIAARLAQARGVAAQLDRDHARESALLAKGAATADTVLAIEDRRRIALAGVAEAEALLAHTRVVAPFAGAITEKFVNAGDFAAPGAPLFVLEAADQLRVEVAVPASAPVPSLGAAIGVDAAPTLAGVLAEVSSAADPATRTRLVKIALPAASTLRSGDFARVRWPVGTRRALVAPAASVAVIGQIERVFVVDGGRVRLRIVKTGVRRDGVVEILAGLEAGEVVVVEPSAALRDGAPVESRP